MIVKPVRASAKGQITLPADVLRALKVPKGTGLMLVQEGDHIVLVPAEAVGRRLVDDLGGWSARAAPSFAELWDNAADEAWDDA